MNSEEGLTAQQNNAQSDINPSPASETPEPAADEGDDLPSFWDEIHPPTAHPALKPSEPAEPSESSEPSEPAADDMRLGHFPNLSRGVLDMLRNPNAAIGRHIVRALPPQERIVLRSAAQALGRPQYAVVSLCIAVGMMDRILGGDDPVLEDDPIMGSILAPFVEGFVHVFGRLPNGQRPPARPTA